jgi:hypothetical protein
VENDVLVKRSRRKKLDAPTAVPLAAIGCKARLGGLLKHYYRRAA